MFLRKLGLRVILLILAAVASGSAKSHSKSSPSKTDKGASSKGHGCDTAARYRNIDGTCNNLRNPSWGSAGSCFRRLLPAVYEGESGIRKTVNGSDLRFAHDLAASAPDPSYSGDPGTQLRIFFGQLVMHEITHTKEQDFRINCCSPHPTHPECVAAILHDNETCAPFLRSVPCKHATDGKRNQVSDVTSFIDGSILYGNDEATTARLRRLDGSGKLKVQHSKGNGALLIETQVPNRFCQGHPVCFDGGDGRINQHMMLTIFQTMLTRDHNRYARKLKHINKHWGEEKLFQEARRIIGAKLQAIVYKEYLPAVLGRDSMTRAGLWVGYPTAYDPDLDPTVINEFSAGVARIGHRRLWHLDEKCQIDNLRHSDEKPMKSVSPPDVKNGYLESIAKAVVYEKPRGCSKAYQQEWNMRTYDLKGIAQFRDMFDVDIFRGRDHGLPSYISMLSYCTGGRTTIRHFDDLSQVMDKQGIDYLKGFYKDVRDIELYSGLIVEGIEEGQVFSPTVVCVQERVFRNLKYGDRFYFENTGLDTSFTDEQINEIRKSSLSKLFCETTHIHEMQPESLTLQGGKNTLRQCKDLPDINLDYWKE